MMTRCTTTMRPRPAAWLAASLLLSSALNQATADSCPADLDRSGVVTGIDLAMLLGDWGACPPLPPREGAGGGLAGSITDACPADLDGSGSVNGFDLGILLGAWGDCPPPASPPKIIYTPVAHQGDAASGFPAGFNVIYDFLLTPQIDAAGNVFFLSFLRGDGIDITNARAYFHGPPGQVTKLLWESDPAPDMPPGIIIDDLGFASSWISETGWVSFSAYVSGSGIIPGVNDQVLYAGPPGDLRKVLQSDDQAPGLPPGVLIQAGEVGLSDHATLYVSANLKGVGVTEANDRAIWTGTRERLNLVWREGMPAPGTPPGVVFAWADFITFNDAGQIAFRGGLSGPGITDDNDSGRWIGGPGTIQLVAWTGVPAPGFPVEISFVAGGGGGTSVLNNLGQVHELALIQGPGITDKNNLVLYAGLPGRLNLIAQEGEVVPAAGEDATVLFFNNPFLNDRSELFWTVKLQGSSLPGGSAFAAFFGLLERPGLELIDGMPAPAMQKGMVLAGTTYASGLASLNDAGSIVTVTKIAGPDVTSQSDTVLWRHDAAYGGWFPLLRAGDTIAGRVVAAAEPADLLGAYWQKTGGSDGYGLSFNDSGRLAIRLDFADGTHGILLIWSESSL